nr:excisionase family DNA-binding protein [Tessaracoccus bendigoensis]
MSLCERTLRRAMANGELTGYRFGKALRVKVTELDAWAESKAMPNARTTGTGRRR